MHMKGVYMIRFFKLFPAFLAMLLAAFCFGGDNFPKADIDSLAWLAGDWAGDFEGNRFECHYTSPEGGAILSVSKEYHEGKRCFIEFEKFEESNSNIIMTPYPDGMQSVGFTLIGFDPAIKQAKFTNYRHDFPTEIIYELVEADKMLITVAGPGEKGRVELKVNLKKVKQAR